MKIARLKYIAKTKIYFTILSLHLLFALTNLYLYVGTRKSVVYQHRSLVSQVLG